LKVIEIEPGDDLLKKYIECYQLFEIAEPLWVKAISTGTLECWIKLRGGFRIFDPKEGRFKPAASSGIFPVGTNGYVFHVPNNTICINIKLSPSVLALSSFKDLINQWESFNFDQFVGESGTNEFRNLDISDFENLSSKIDAIVKAHNDFESIDSRIQSVLTSIIASGNHPPTVKELAFENHLTIKSLERLIKKVFGMTPKKLIGILRFGNSIKFLNKTEGHRFIEALKFGYYDQSHFIRECNKIAEMNPSDILSELSLNTNDIIISSIEPEKFNEIKNQHL